MIAYFQLALVPIAGAVGNIAQTLGANRAARHDRIDPTLLRRLVAQPLYLLGFCAQVVGFVLAFLARGSLPLYLVQAGSCAAIGLTALAGAVLFRWRMRAVEVVALVGMGGGIVLLAGAAVPSTAGALSPTAVAVLAGTLVLVAALAVPAARSGATRTAVVLGGLAGLAFGVMGILGRPLAARPLVELPVSVTFWLLLGAALVGQTLFATALQRGSTTATVAAMEATAVVLAASVGLTVLGDRVGAGRGWWVLLGLVLVVAGVVALAAFVGPQLHSSRVVPPEPQAPRPEEEGSAVPERSGDIEDEVGRWRR